MHININVYMYVGLYGAGFVKVARSWFIHKAQALIYCMSYVVVPLQTVHSAAVSSRFHLPEPQPEANQKRKLKVPFHCK